MGILGNLGLGLSGIGGWRKQGRESFLHQGHPQDLPGVPKRHRKAITSKIPRKFWIWALGVEQVYCIVLQKSGPKAP